MIAFRVLGALLAAGLLMSGFWALFKLPDAVGGQFTIPVPYTAKQIKVTSKSPGVLILSFAALAVFLTASAGDIYMDAVHWEMWGAAAVFLFIGSIVLWRLPKAVGARAEVPGWIVFTGGAGLSIVALSIVLFAALVYELPRGIWINVLDDVGAGSCIASERATVYVEGSRRGTIIVNEQHPTSKLSIWLPAPGEYSYRVEAVATVSNSPTARDGEGVGRITANSSARDFRIASQSQCNIISSPPGGYYQIVLCRAGQCPTAYSRKLRARSLSYRHDE